MIYLIVGLLCLVTGLLAIHPLIKGERVSPWPGSATPETLENWLDRRESIKLSLRDLDLEFRIGKLDKDDFEALKAELLGEWAVCEEQIKKHEA